MKRKWTSLLAMVFAVMLCLSCFGITALAAETQTQYDLEATIATDKEAYTANEEINVTVTVKNTNDFEVKDVSIESLIPETLKLKSGADSTKTVDLEPGEMLTLSFTAVQSIEETSATEPESQSTEPAETEPVIPSESETAKPSETETVPPSESESVIPSETQALTQEPDTTAKPTATIPATTAPFSTENSTTIVPSTTQPATNGMMGNLTTMAPAEATTAYSGTTTQAGNPDTGDSFSVKTLAIALIALFSLIAIVIILLYKYKKQTTKIISLVMCVALAASAITGVTFFTADGVNDSRKSFTVSKIILVNGEETEVSATVNYIDKVIDVAITEFKADTWDIYVNESKKVSFKATVNSKTNLTNQNIEVYDTNGNFICSLSNSDENSGNIAGNYIYSGTAILLNNSPANIGYYAKCGDVQSPIFEICYYRNITEQELSEFQKLLDNIQENEKSLKIQGLNNSELYTAMLSFLKQQSQISKIEVDENKNISFKTIWGITSVWSIGEENVISTGSDSIGNEEFNVPNLRSINQKSFTYETTISNTKIALLFPYRGSDDSFLYEAYEELANTIANKINGTVTIFNGNEVSLDCLKKLDQYGIVLFYSHGAMSNVSNSAWSIWNNNPYTLTGEYHSIKNGYLSDDFFSERIVISASEGRLGVGAKFYDKYYAENSFDGSFFHFGSCNSMRNNSIADVLISKGVAVTEGFSNNVTFNNDLAHLYSIFAYLLEGYEIDESIKLAIDSELVQQHKQTDCELRYTVNPDCPNYKLVEKIPDVAFAGGNGTAENPYQVATAQQLNAVRCDLDAHYIQTADIDLSQFDNWEPIGYMSLNYDENAGYGFLDFTKAFSGCYDGQGHTIFNMKIQKIPSCYDEAKDFEFSLGLFGTLKNDAVIKNINIKDINLDITFQNKTDFWAGCTLFIGGIVGYIDGGQILDCSVAGNFDIDVQDSMLWVGGISGYRGSIIRCKNKCKIQTTAVGNKISVVAGGITGSLGKIEKCINFSDISGDVSSSALNGGCYIGGISGSGDQYTSSIVDSINYGSIYSKIYGPASWNGGIDCRSYAGGISGYTFASIENCFNMCNSIDAIEEILKKDVIVVTRRYAGRITGTSNIIRNKLNYSINTCLVNDTISTEYIGPDQQNGGSMTREEIEQAIAKIDFGHTVDLPKAS